LTSKHKGWGELAQASGTTAETIARLAQAGILQRDPGQFVPSVVGKVRLVLALENSGVSVEELGAAIRAGSVSLEFLRDLMPAATPLLPRTHAEVADGLRMPRSLSQRVRSVLGTSTASDGEPVRQDDAELCELVARARRAGAPEEEIARAVLVFADNVRRIVTAQRDFVDQLLIEPFLAAGGSPRDVLSETRERRRDFTQLGHELLLLLQGVESRGAEERVRDVTRLAAVTREDTPDR
jgi:hypothetical protein